MSGTPAESNHSDKPTSRLSNRITKCPASTSARHRSSSHWIICAPRPITSKSGRSLRRPNVSYSIFTPLTRVWGIVVPCLSVGPARNVPHPTGLDHHAPLHVRREPSAPRDSARLESLQRRATARLESLQRRATARLGSPQRRATARLESLQRRATARAW